MSSMFQQEIKKPAPKSPIPRSRSDFNYVGLTTKEKRWTTDFSLLLPAFPRDSSGYARLTETPVTIQPRTKTKHLKSPCTDSGTICNNHFTEPKKYVHNPCNANSVENKRDNISQPVVCCRSKHPLNNLNQVCRQHLKPEVSMRKSPTMDPKILASSPRKIPNIICRSPTLDPTFLTRSPKAANRWPPPVDSKNAFINRSPLCGESYSTDVVRSQSLRSLRRSSEKSPTKLRNSESAQSDVTGSSFK